MGVKIFGIFLFIYALGVGYLMKNGTPEFLKTQVITEEMKSTEAALPGPSGLTKREPAGHAFDKIIATAQAMESIKGMILGEKTKPIELEFRPRDTDWSEVVLVGLAQALPVTFLFFVLGLIFTGKSPPLKAIKNENVSVLNLGVFKREKRFLDSSHCQIRYQWNVGIYKGTRSFEVGERASRKVDKTG